MNTAEGYEDNLFNYLRQNMTPIQKVQMVAFNDGMEYMLKRFKKELTKVATPWIQGKITDEEFARKLNEFIQNYGH